MKFTLFVSYVYQDKRWKDKIISWASTGRLGNVKVVSEPPDVRPGGDTAIKKKLSPKLKKAVSTIVLIGQNTHNHGWINYEINHTLSENKKVFLIRIPNTTGAPPDLISDRSTYKEIAFEPNVIKKRLLLAMRNYNG